MPIVSVPPRVGLVASDAAGAPAARVAATAVDATIASAQAVVVVRLDFTRCLISAPSCARPAGTGYVIADPTTLQLDPTSFRIYTIRRQEDPMGRAPVSSSK